MITFAQGSYRNRTNISLDSDVDVCICYKDVFFADYPAGTTRETFGILPASYTYTEFKNDVENALVNCFGRNQVKRGNKAFDIKDNTYRVEADAVPTFQHRRYSLDGSYLEGVELRPDIGEPSRIINWPQQVYDNGVLKHTNTVRRYKKNIRILKNLRNQMQEDGVKEAKDIASFLIECLVWNVPNSNFGSPTLTEDVRHCLAFLISNTGNDSNDKDCYEWGEVSELKYLFRGQQPWTQHQAHRFALACWIYLGFS